MVDKPKKKSYVWAWLLGAFALFIIVGFIVTLVLVVLLASDTSFGPLEGNKIGVVRIDGLISGGGSEEGLFGAQSGTTPENFRVNLKEAVEDSSVKAIVIRVNSGGGTPAASQEMFAEVRNAAKKKPVVASVSDVAASGAYYSISPVKKIVADPASYVGSIGVFMEVPVLKGLYQKLGIEYNIIKAGKYKALGHSAKNLTPQEKRILQKQVDEIYNQFINDVALGRKNLDTEDVKKLANGLGFPGTEAKRLGLVDELGGYSVAIKEAAKLAGIKKYDVVDYNDSGTLNISDFVKSFIKPNIPKESISIR